MPSQFKQDNPGCDCCGCTEPPSCTLTGSKSGSTVTLSWTITGVEVTSAVITDHLGATIETITLPATAGTTVVTSGLCRQYTLTVINACGSSTCVYTETTCTICARCLSGTLPSTFTVNFTYNGVLNACGCGDAATARCSQFDGSFTVSGGVSSCEWTGGAFGSTVFCEASRGPWNLKLTIQQGDCTGANTGNTYAIIQMSYSVVDPLTCVEIGKFQRLIATGTTPLDCGALIPGTYTACSTGSQTLMCDVSCTVS